MGVFFSFFLHDSLFKPTDVKSQAAAPACLESFITHYYNMILVLFKVAERQSRECVKTALDKSVETSGVAIKRPTANYDYN